MKRNIILIFVLLSTMLLFSYENEQADETWLTNLHTLEFHHDINWATGLVFCDPVTPGEESHWSITGHLKVGDARDWDYVNDEYYNFWYRMFLNYNLEEIYNLPEEAEILAVRVRLYLIGHWGQRNGYGTIEFPYWDGYEQTEHECTLSHVDLGDSLGVEDWNAGEPGHPGTLESNLGIVATASVAATGYDPYEDEGISGYKRIDVTQAVLSDMEEGKLVSQFRVAFMGMESDNDSWFDILDFHPGYPCVRMPYMEVDYLLPDGERVYTSNVEVQTQISVLPNPVRNFASIEYLLPGVRNNQEYGIYNIRGQKVAGGQVSGERGNIQLDFSKYPSGNYLIKMGDKTSKFLKLKR